MLIPSEIKKAAELIIAGKESEGIKITSFEPLSGGSINHAFKVIAGNKTWFLKWNYTKKHPSMFDAEAKGLTLLRQSNTIAIPEVVASKETGLFSFLLLEFVEKGQQENAFFEQLGKELALMHKNTSSHFGLDHNNYIGSLSQSNNKHKDWVEFFIVERLEPQLKIARNSGLIDRSANKQFEKLFSVLNEIFPVEPPSLLHGDLWSGNYLCGPEGKPYLIDPAVYYGHREMDVAMSKLFGGFGDGFYDSYNNEWPMEKGWEKRLDISNLYPLLVHVNLFGTGYVQQVSQIIKRF